MKLHLFWPAILATVLTSLLHAQDAPRQRVQIQDPNELRQDPDYPKLKGDWEVKSVQHDGNLTAAQIGQKAGDVISMIPFDRGLMFS